MMVPTGTGRASRAARGQRSGATGSQGEKQPGSHLFSPQCVSSYFGIELLAAAQQSSY